MDSFRFASFCLLFTRKKTIIAARIKTNNVTPTPTPTPIEAKSMHTKKKSIGIQSLNKNKIKNNY